MTLSLLEASAKGFAARHRADFDELERRLTAGSMPELLAEVAELGWLGALYDPDAHAPNDDDASLLARIVYVLGGASPAFAARLLAHHFVRACVDGTGAPRLASSTSSPWYGLEASIGDPNLGSTCRIESTNGETRLNGSVRSVVGGDFAPYWLIRARLSPGEQGFVLVDASTAVRTTSTPTLGLRGLGVVDAEFNQPEADRFQVVVNGSALETRVAGASRFIAPGYFALLRCLVEQTQMLATNHAGTRRQNGVHLREIPAVRELLERLRRAIALVSITERACQEHWSNASQAIETLRAAAREATDAGLQTLGGAGYIVDHGVERRWRDCLQLSALFFHDPW